MQFGSGAPGRGGPKAAASNKYEYACAVAASLAYLLLRQQDSVGLTSFDAAVRAAVPSRSKRNHLYSVLAALDAQNPAEKTDIYNILAQVADRESQRGMIVLIS